LDRAAASHWKNCMRTLGKVTLALLGDMGQGKIKSGQLGALALYAECTLAIW